LHAHDLCLRTFISLTALPYVPVLMMPGEGLTPSQATDDVLTDIQELIAQLSLDPEREAIASELGGATDLSFALDALNTAHLMPCSICADS
jgi:hypothetical protein